MTQSQALAISDGAGAVGPTRQFNAEQRALLKATVAKGTSDLEFALFCEVAQRTGLNPFARQIHAVMRKVKEGDSWVSRMTIQTGIDGYRLIAQRTGEYVGQVGPEWCGPDGEWRDVWLSSTPPSAARVGVWRRGFVEPVWGVATLASYQQTTGQGEQARPTAMWARMPDVLLAKCAEGLALRKAFPQELSGVYTDDEIDQADSGPAPTSERKPSIAPPKASRRTPRTPPAEPPFGTDDEAAIEGEARDIPDDAPPAALKDERPISRFWRETRAVGITREQVVEHLGHERFEDLDEAEISELATQLFARFGKSQPELGV